MTKKERELVDALTEARDMARALRWPEYGEPERRPAPASFDHAEGFLFNEHRGASGESGAVFEAWSECTSHGYGRYSGGGVCRNGIQGGRALYRTREDALRAMRLRLTEKFARILARLDKQIAEATEAESAHD